MAPKYASRSAFAPPLDGTHSRDVTRIAVVYYSMYGHIGSLAESITKGIKEGAPDAQVDVFLVPETLPQEVLEKMHAQKKPDLPTITAAQLKEYDGFAFGIPTRYGRTPAQWSAFMDTTGGLWASGALVGKMATCFTSSASQHGGQETTTLTTMPFFAHHGVMYVPFGFQLPAIQNDNNEVIAGSAYGAGAIAGGQGERAVTEKEHSLGVAHGQYFGKVVTQFVKGAA